MTDVPRERAVEVFDGGEGGCGRVVFLHIAWLAEGSLLNIVASNHVAALVDLRPGPVFARPRFRHRHVIRYFYESNVEYLEYAIHINRARRAGIRAGLLDQATERFREVLSRGLTLCVYNDASRSAGWIEEFRRLLREAPAGVAELHPRALSGAEEIGACL